MPKISAVVPQASQSYDRGHQQQVLNLIQRIIDSGSVPETRVPFRDQVTGAMCWVSVENGALVVTPA